MRVATRAAGSGRWSKASAIGKNGVGTVDPPSVAIRASGRVAVEWSVMGPGCVSIRGACYSQPGEVFVADGNAATGRWATPRVVSGGGRRVARTARIVFDSSGRTVVVWDAATRGVAVRTRTADGRWRPIVYTTGSIGSIGTWIAPAIDRHGRGVVAVDAYRRTSGVSLIRLRASAGGRYLVTGQPIRFSSHLDCASCGLGAVQAALDDNGRVVLGWVEGIAGHPPSTVYAAAGRMAP